MSYSSTDYSGGIASLLPMMRTPGVGVGTPSGITALTDAGTPAAYGGYAATPADEATLMARRYNPFAYIQTGAQPQQVAQQAADDYRSQATGNGIMDFVDQAGGYAGGGIASLLPGYADGGDVSGGNGILDLLLQLGGLKRAASSSGDEGGAGIASGTANSGNTPASMSGANYGGTNYGGNGIGPGRSAGVGVAGTLAGLAIPGAGTVGQVGNAFNGYAQSAALTGLANDLGYSSASPVAQGLLGAVGLGGMTPASFTSLAMSQDPSLTKSDVQSIMDSFNETMAPSHVTAAANAPGAFGSPGPSPMGTNDVNPASAAAFGAPPGTSMSQGLDGVVSANETPGGSSAAGGAPGGQSSGGDPSGAGQGGPGNGEASGGAWAAGGTIGAIRPFSSETFTRKMMGGSGLVPGMGGGRSDTFHVRVPHGAYVIPADAVSGAGGGNTLAGAKAIAGAIPHAPGLMRFASGGIAGDVPTVPIRISSGEFVVHPDHVAAIGNGDPQAGSDALDRMVAQVRQQAAQQVAGLGAPR